jgi:hypothetical protein
VDGSYGASARACTSLNDIIVNRTSNSQAIDTDSMAQGS